MAWTTLTTIQDGTVVNQGHTSSWINNLIHLGGTLGDTKTGNYNITGTLYVATPPVTIGASAAASGTIRLGNTTNIMWRNGGGSGDLGLLVDAADRLVFAVAGASWSLGGAIASTTSSLQSLSVVLNGNAYKLALYA